MEFASPLVKTLFSFLPMSLTLLIGLLVIHGIRKFLEKRYRVDQGNRYKQHLTVILLAFALLLLIIMTAPIGDNQRGQLLSLIGLLSSAIIALSSTTFVGNAMAGFMLRAVRSFRIGDFVRIGDHFGRVTERGLLHVEIQTEDRDLTTLPNLYLVTNPVKVIRSSGTLITGEVTLGYDVPRIKVQELLIKAAEATELKDPFVHVIVLGDFSVKYRVAGLLTEVKQLISTRSKLHEQMLDKLHEGGIEIVSPNFMNTRSIAVDEAFIPKAVIRAQEPIISQEKAPEDVVFDKAEEQESLEMMQVRRKQIEDE
ncbi:mechanosensitive ion channel family protein, partial [bacterium]|nr:mechanosensitive ion channel family protein [bacterium]